MQKKDSIGNDLPQSIFLRSDATTEQIGQALTINSFNLAVSMSLQKGLLVIYDKDRKQATVTGIKGFTYTLSHE